LLVGALGTLAATAALPAGAQACTFGSANAQPITPVESASIVQTSDPLPVRIRFGDNGTFAPVQFAIARLKTSTVPPLAAGMGMPPEVGAVVETVALTYDAAADGWGADANGNDWARTPGEYAWQVSGWLTIPDTRPPDVVAPCGRGPWTLLQDGRRVHRLTVIRASAVTANAAKARHGRAKVSGRVAKAFPGKIRLTVACPGKRARTTFVATADGRWGRTMIAKRGCTIKAAAAAREGWAASETSARIT
jgi:hypothetical protein